jgi:hypothetical protein
MFSIGFPHQPSDINFHISTDNNDWGAQMGDGSIIPLSNPVLLYLNRDSAIVQFDMSKSYPSNSPCLLVYRSDTARFKISYQDDQQVTFKQHASGNFAFTTNNYGATTDENGNTDKLLATFSYPPQAPNIEFYISRDSSHWGVQMGDGTIIKLSNPQVVKTNLDCAVVLFDMNSSYPANSPCILVYMSQNAYFRLNYIDDVPFVSVTKIIDVPAEILTGVPYNLSGAQVVPYNASVSSIIWSVVSGTAAINDNIILTNTAGTIKIRATLNNAVNGSNNVKSNFTQDFTITAKKNVITIVTNPSSYSYITLDNINQQLSVVAKSTSDVIYYQWYRNSINSTNGATLLEGETNSTYVIPQSTTSGTYYYFCKLSSPGANDVYTSISQVIVKPKLTGIKITSSTSVYEITNKYQLTANPIPTDADLPSITWYLKTDDQLCRLDEKGTLIVALDDYPVASAKDSSGNFSRDNHGYIHIDKDITGSTIVAKTAPVNGEIFSDTLNIDIKQYVRVTGIENVPTVIETDTDYILSGTVKPSNAEKKEIIWELLYNNNVFSTSAKLTASGNGSKVLRASNIGYLRVQATIKNGLRPNEGSAYETVNGYFVSSSNKFYRDASYTTEIAGEEYKIYIDATSSDRYMYSAEKNTYTKIIYDYVEVFDIQVINKYYPINDIIMTGYNGSYNSGEFCRLKFVASWDTSVTNYPSYTNVTAAITSKGSTDAILYDDGIFTATKSGVAKITATVKNGKAIGEDFTKEFSISVNGAFIVAEGISGVPSTWDKVSEPLSLASATVSPSTASVKTIEWELVNPTPANVTFDKNTKTLSIAADSVTWWEENPDYVNSSSEDDTQDSFYIEAFDDKTVELKATVKGGGANKSDAEFKVEIVLIFPDAPSAHINLENVKLEYPSIIRAKRPIILSMAEKDPWNASTGDGGIIISYSRNINDNNRDPDNGLLNATGGMGLQFLPYTQDAATWKETYNVTMDSEYDWDYKAPEGSKDSYDYFYNFEDGDFYEVTQSASAIQQVNDAGETSYVNYETFRTVTFLPEYIPVADIINIPSSFPTNVRMVLGPECETNLSVVARDTQTYDTEIPSYSDVSWSIVDKGSTNASISNGVLTATAAGTCKIRATVANGTKEEYTWYATGKFDKDVENGYLYKGTFYSSYDSDNSAYKDEITPDSNKIYNNILASNVNNKYYKWDGSAYNKVSKDEHKYYKHTGESYTQDFNINFYAPSTHKYEVLKLTLSNNNTVSIFNEEEIYNLSNNLPANTTITAGGSSFTKNQVTKISFWSSKVIEKKLKDKVNPGDPDEYEEKEIDNPETYSITSLANFARNFTSLTSIDRIPDSVSGGGSLRNFLAGCTSFNQSLTIPSGVTGARCLEGFLKGCTSYNQAITIPSGVTGERCLEGFLDGCTSFNQDLTIPSGVTGDKCLMKFLHGCTSFNKPLTIPDKKTEGSTIIHPGVSGRQCLDHFLWKCSSFNQDITIPDSISGDANMRSFMLDTSSYTATVTVSSDAVDKIEGNGLTLSQYDRGNAYDVGIQIAGTGADKFIEKFRNMLSVSPLRNLKKKG